MAVIEITKGNLVLLRDVDAGPKFHFLETIYLGEDSKDNPLAVIVPNIGDMVVDRSSGMPRWLEVVDVDDNTLVAVLEEYQKDVETTTMSTNQRLLGIGSGYQSETWRLYLDTSVVPHVIQPDSRLHVYGKENTKYKIFLGTDISASSGKVISMNFNANGELLGEDIPLEKVAFPSSSVVDNNLTVKAPRKAYTNTKMDNGEVVTLCVYNDEGQMTAYNTLLVHNTALDRNIESMHRYVSSISLVSPFLDPTENNTLVFPINMPHKALALMGRVNYSDGSFRTVTINDQNSRMRLHGLDNYVAMKENQTINLVLTYHLPQDEMALNSSVGEGRFVSVKYFGRTTPVEGSYSINLCPVPTWVSDTFGWQMKYYLYTLERDIAYDVTNAVRPAATAETFNPLLYGTYQELSVSLNLHDVNPNLKNFVHVQTYQVALMGRPGPGLKTSWHIKYEKDQPKPYGTNLRCTAIRDKGLNITRLSMDCGAKNVDEWLERLYYRSMPLLDKYSEKRPPRPTHFTINIDSNNSDGVESNTYPIQAWNSVFSTEHHKYDGYGVAVQWTRLEDGEEYQLGMSPVPYVDISDGDVDEGGGTIVKPENPDVDETIIDIDLEVQRIIDRGASEPVAAKYRMLLEHIKKYGLLRYETINNIYQRIRETDMTPAIIANDVTLLDIEVKRIDISDFERVKGSHYAPMSMEE